MRQTHKRIKRTLFISTRQNQQIFAVTPIVKLQNDKQQLKILKLKNICKAKPLIDVCFPVQCMEECWYDSGV